MFRRRVRRVQGVLLRSIVGLLPARSSYLCPPNYLPFIMRLLVFVPLLFVFSSLRADDLSARLRLLLPGEEPSTVNARQFLYQRVSKLLLTLEEEDKVDRKSTKKKINRIKSRLQKDLFRAYAPAAELADAFRVGKFNDATAVVLTALVFEHFELDYIGYIDHWEAYLVADPEGRNETMRRPGSRKRKEGEEAAFRRDYLSMVATTLEVDFSGADQALMDKNFTDYFYAPSRGLSFGQLSAYLLFRRAQVAYLAGGYETSIAHLEEALKREERPAFLVLKRAAELQITARDRPEVEGDIDEFYALWAENPANRYLPAAILQFFDEQQRLLLAQGREDLATKLLGDYLSRAPAGSGEWGTEMNRLHRLRLLAHYHKSGRINRAKTIADELYAEVPDNETVRYVLGELVIDGLRRAGGSGAGFTRRVEAAAEKYPFIRTQDRFADLLLRELAWKVRDLYAEDRPDLAAPALERFRQSLIDIPIGRERNLWTLTAFAAASNYHFRVEDYHGARQFIDEALRFAPDDPYLTHRRYVLGRY